MSPFLRNSLGSWNPVGCMVSVFATPGEAQRAVSALQTQGFSEAQICLLPPTALPEWAELSRARSSPMARAACALLDWTDNAALMAEYLGEARRGRYLVVVHAPSAEQMWRASEAVGRSGGQLTRHYGPWVVRRFSA